MERADIEILVKHENHWVTLSQAGFVKNLEHNTLIELEGVYKRNVSLRPVNKYCKECISSMIKDIYRNYDELKKSLEEVKPATQLKERKPRVRKSRAKAPKETKA